MTVGLLVQAAVAQSLLRRLARSRSSDHSDFSPRVTVLMAVRGHDPSLDDCLRGLIDQNYPDYQVIAVVDSADDPACQPLTACEQQFGPSRIQTVVASRHRTTCGGKANALLEAVPHLDANTEVVAIIDSDAVPPRNWLRDLVAPLANPGVGLVTGNRWFEMQPGSFGSAVRSAWNIGALLQMYASDVPWGGCLAMRRTALEENGILETWERVFSDDVPLRDLTIDAGQVMARVPHLLLVSRETCRTSDLLEWTTRQLLSVWAFLRRRWLLVGTGIYFFTLLATLPVMLGVGCANSDSATLSWLAVETLTTVVGLFILAHWIERRTCAALLQNGDRVRKLGWNMLPAVVMAFSIHSLGCVSIIFRRKFHWRGKTYIVHGPRSVDVHIHAPAAPISLTPGESLLA